MNNLYTVAADDLISRCNLGKMDNRLHQTLWAQIDAHKDVFDLAEICAALSVASTTHGTPSCRSYIHNILKLAVGPSLERLLTEGKTQQFDILVEHMTDTYALGVFERAIEQKYWRGGFICFSETYDH